MDEKLSQYLFYRNTQSILSIIVLFIYVLGLIFISGFIIVLTHSPVLLLGLLFLPFLAIVFFGLKDIIKSHSTPPYMGEESSGMPYNRIRKYIAGICESISLTKPVKVYYDPRSDRIGIRTYSKVAHLLVGADDLLRNESILLAILAHELIHVRNNDSLKRGFIKIIGNLMVAYTIILCFLLFQIWTLPAFMFTTGILGLTGLYLYYLPFRIMEHTADGGAVLMGYGNSLISLLSQLKGPISGFGFVFVHDTPKSRLANVRKILEEYF